MKGRPDFFGRPFCIYVYVYTLRQRGGQALEKERITG